MPGLFIVIYHPFIFFLSFYHQPGLYASQLKSTTTTSGGGLNLLHIEGATLRARARARARARLRYIFVILISIDTMRTSNDRPVVKISSSESFNALQASKTAAHSVAERRAIL